MKGNTYPAHKVNGVSHLCFGCDCLSELLPSSSIDDHVLLPLFAQSGHRSFAVTPLLRLADVAIKLNLNQHVTIDPAFAFFGSACRLKSLVLLRNQ